MNCTLLRGGKFLAYFFDKIIITIQLKLELKN